MAIRLQRIAMPPGQLARKAMGAHHVHKMGVTGPVPSRSSEKSWKWAGVMGAAGIMTILSPGSVAGHGYPGNPGLKIKR
jgi:hypothetical protein